MTHPITNKPLKFETQEEFMNFLRYCNPSMLRSIKGQYEAKYPKYEIIGIGGDVEIKRKKKR